MIKIEPGRTTELGTGKNVSGTADTFLESGPKDDLITVDAYKAKKGLVSTNSAAAQIARSNTTGGSDTTVANIRSSAAINSVPTGVNATTPSTENDNSLSSMLWTTLLCGKSGASTSSYKARTNKMFDTSLFLRSTGCSAENLLDFVKVENGEFSFSQDELRRRMDNSVDGSVAMLTEDENNSLVSGLAANLGTDGGTLQAKVGEVTTFMEGGKIGEVDSLSTMLSLIPGGGSLIETLDLTAEFVFLDMLVEKTIDLGLPQLTKGLFLKIENDKVLNKVLRNRLRQSAYTSDLETVQEIISRIGRGAAQSDEPDLVEVITSNYRLGRRTRTSDYPTKRTELLATLTAFDPTWFSTTRNGVVVNNLAPFTVASRDALTMFKGSDHELLASVSSPYKSRHYSKIVPKYHPLAAGIGR
jgi:hypothetical protein